MGVFSNAKDINLLFNDMFPYKSPLQAGSSPIPGIPIWPICQYSFKHLAGKRHSENYGSFLPKNRVTLGLQSEPLDAQFSAPRLP